MKAQNDLIHTIFDICIYIPYHVRISTNWES